jgi:hypothetical protein
MGELQELERQALASQCEVSQKIAYVEQVENFERGAVNKAKFDEAGEKERVKFEQNSPECEVAAEIVSNVSPAVGIASNLIQGVNATSNPSNSGSKDVAQAKAAGAKSFEDSFKEIKTATGRSFTEKSGTLVSSMKSLTNKDTKGIKQSEQGASTVQVSSLKRTLENQYSHGITNEQVLSQVQAQMKNNTFSPGGMGSGGGKAMNDPYYAANVKAMELKHASPENGPKFNEEDWA